MCVTYFNDGISVAPLKARWFNITNKDLSVMSLFVTQNNMAV